MAHHTLIFAFGILGNIISIMMYLAPIPTFMRVYRNKTTEGFQSIPYVVALFAALVWVYYATLKSNDYLLLSINCFGCIVETIYVSVFIFYAPKKARVLTLQQGILSILGFSSIFALTHFLTKGINRLHIVGWFCVALSAAVFAAPLSILRLVIRTKSVEFMPFTLSLFLTLSAILWFLYGMLLRDFFIAMICYAIYNKRAQAEQPKLPEPKGIDGISKPSPIKSLDFVKAQEEGNEAPCRVQLAEYAKKSTEEFQSFPYLAALFSAMLWIYYATTKSNAFLLITINSFGCAIEAIYISLYIAYAPRQARMLTLALLVLLNFGGFCLILIIAQFFVKETNRRLVIKTKSVEFMPFCLSFFLTINAITWLFYGVVVKDFYIEMLLYIIYKNCKTPKTEPKMEAEILEHTIDIAKLTGGIDKIQQANILSDMEEENKRRLSKYPIHSHFKAYPPVQRFWVWVDLCPFSLLNTRRKKGPSSWMDLHGICSLRVPNILGFIFGILQMILYLVYRNYKPVEVEKKVQELSDHHIVDIEKLGATICELNPVVIPDPSNNGTKGVDHEEQTEKKEEAKGACQPN
ncbi:hypothetical protein Tsubulata_000613 [Turnera subulata]|uniref:Bidirectional sugar transporter SWEET n=1 Tax=Turnera subulata TaxID=218843 RepID=A0A9Q0JQA0_9ROSI|nr:hypothetical protein Tsubulata_000613 [Turnera subulata]